MKTKQRMLLYAAAVLVLGTSTLHAQTRQPDSAKQKTARNILYAELGGNSLIYSFNYERILVQKKKFQFSFRAGFGCYPFIHITSSDGIVIQNYMVNSVMVIPVEGFFAFGRGRHKFEVSAGVTPMIIESSERTSVVYPNGDITESSRSTTDCIIGVGPGLAYRYEKPDGGFFLRAGVSVNYYFNTDPAASTTLLDLPLPLPRLSLGYKFRR